jgi:hypothetical protein
LTVMRRSRTECWTESELSIVVRPLWVMVFKNQRLSGGFGQVFEK